VLDKDATALQELSKELPKVIVQQVDLLNWEETKKIVTQLSPLHHLVNNAGIMLPGSVLDITMENFDL
jgi:NADP-dependent 3-hydroxy acid dehydrogenase YdfG